MKRVVLGIAAVLVVAVQTGARAEEAWMPTLTLVTSTAPEVQGCSCHAGERRRCASLPPR